MNFMEDAVVKIKTEGCHELECCYVQVILE